MIRRWSYRALRIDRFDWFCGQSLRVTFRLVAPDVLGLDRRVAVADDIAAVVDFRGYGCGGVAVEFESLLGIIVFAGGFDSAIRRFGSPQKHYYLFAAWIFFLQFNTSSG